MEMAGVSYPMEKTKQSNCGTSGKWCPMLIGTLNKSKYKSIPFSLSTNINSYTTWKECSCLFFCFAPLFILNTLTYIHACPNKLICGMRRCICWDTDIKVSDVHEDHVLLDPTPGPQQWPVCWLYSLIFFWPEDSILLLQKRLFIFRLIGHLTVWY